MLLRALTVVTLLLAVYQTHAQDGLDDLFNSVFSATEAAIFPDPVPTQAPVPTPPPVYTCSGECVPYYLCVDNQIVTDGTGIIDIRHGEDNTQENECPSYMDTCCEKDVLIEPPPTYKPTPPPTEDHQTCGLRNADGLGFRITGNSAGESEYGEFPWMMAVLREDKIMESTLNVYECGGSLIAPNVVMTTAHCVADQQKESLVVRGGEWDTQTKNELYAHQDLRVREVIVHESFNKRNLANDIALLIMEQPFVLAANIQPVCLPPVNTKFDGQNCVASGWGKNIFGKEGKYQVILKKVQLPIVSHDKCEADLHKTRLTHRFRLDKSFICAGGAGQDTCRGDGGSPLVCPIPGIPNHYYQAGIVAWGIGCNEPGVPAVYVNVPLFRNWIDQQLSQRHVEAKHYTYA